MLHITPLYAVLLTFMYVFLSIRTIRVRAKHKIGIGDAQNPTMIRAIRVHANFAEYTPLALILFTMMEVNVMNPNLIHGLCIVFIIGRILHAYGVSQTNEKFIYRMIAMPLTFTTMATAAICLLLQYI